MSHVFLLANFFGLLFGIAEGNSTVFFDGANLGLERPGIYTMIFFGLMIFHWDLHALIHPSGGEVGPNPPN